MAAPHVLSIDLGTGGPKVALVAADGRLAAAASRLVQTYPIPPAGAEQDPEEIWGAIRDATREVVRRSGVPKEAIVGVCVASQFSSIVPIDRSGRAVANLIVWMDGRGAPYGQEIYRRRPEAGGKFLEIHGALPLPGGNDSLSHMLWFKHERPEVYERTHNFVEPMDFVTARLTGECTANACTTFMMLLTDNRKVDAIDYDKELIEFSGIDREKLPDLVPVGSCVGTLLPDVAEELGLSRETRVFSGLNDTQAVAIGSGSYVEGQGGINIGTTSQVLAHVSFKDTDVARGIVSAPSPIPGRYLALAENGLGAKTLDHFLHQVVFASDALGDHAVPDAFAPVEAAIGRAPAGSGGLLFLPWLTGAAAPSSNPTARGGFLNLALDTTRERMLRAVCEGVAFNVSWLVPAVEEFARQKYDFLHFSGGAALSDEWSGILADVIGRPVLQVEDARHVINRATAILAFQSLGLAKLDDLPSLCHVRRTYEPRPENREIYDRLFEQFVAAFEQNRPIFDALNGSETEE
jgi:xylulokinase